MMLRGHSSWRAADGGKQARTSKRTLRAACLGQAGPGAVPPEDLAKTLADAKEMEQHWRLRRERLERMLADSEQDPAASVQSDSATVASDGAASTPKPSAPASPPLPRRGPLAARQRSRSKRRSALHAVSHSAPALDALQANTDATSTVPPRTDSRTTYATVGQDTAAGPGGASPSGNTSTSADDSPTPVLARHASADAAPTFDLGKRTAPRLHQLPGGVAFGTQDPLTSLTAHAAASAARGLRPKPIYVVADCTGESAAHTCRAAMGQFETENGVLAPTNIVIFRFVETKRRVRDILQKAKDADALVVYTLVNVKMVRAMRVAARALEVRIVDLWGQLLDEMEDHLDASRIGTSMLAETRRRVALSPQYFDFIEAVEFTRKHDDGVCPDGWHDADLLVVGVSRCGKTPLAIYLGQRGYKVANLPLVPEAPLPPQLFQIDPHKVVALEIDPGVLARIRATRVSRLGVQEDAAGSGEEDAFDYAGVKRTAAEMKWALTLYNRHPAWLRIDVTLRSIEETSARILKEVSARFGDEHPIMQRQ